MWNMSIQRKFTIGLVLFLSMLILWYQMRQRNIISKLPSNREEAEDLQKQMELIELNNNVEPQTKSPIQITAPPNMDRIEKPATWKGPWPPGAPGAPPPVEGFGVFTSQETDLANELASVSTPLNAEGSIKTYNEKLMGNYPIKEYLIKAAYNTACTGKYMNADMIKHVLSLGCRYLDFQLCYDTNTQAVLVSSFMPDNVTKKVSVDLSLLDALKTIGKYGFSGPSPNLGDPLFIQFRFNVSNQYGISNYKSDMTSTVAALLETQLSNRFYQSKVDITTPIGDLMGKYVIVSDTKIEDKNGKDLVNIDLGLGKFPKFTSKDVDNYMSNHLTIDSDTKMSNTTMIRFVEPIASDTKNLDATRIMNQYGSQVVEQMYYVLDNNLKKYETMYYNLGTAFIPLHMAKEFFTNLH